MRELRDEKLDFWIQNSLNVLFIGHYGSGKTTRILDAFKRNKLKFKYFSAATMDPWCDFIGVPKVMTDEKGAYLDYILPRDLRDDDVEAIYMDEFNRSHKKVRNAVMELLQFKSMNGRKFNNLRLIWAAINPENEGDYQVDALDKAQKDRFQIHVSIPYEPKEEFYTAKFNSPQARAALGWWNALSDEHKMEVSPRRLEYALQVYNMPGGDIRDVLPHETDPGSLFKLLKTGPIDERLKDLFKQSDIEAARKYLKVENNYAAALKYLTKQIPDGVDANDWMGFFLQAISTEKLSSLLATNEEGYKFIVENCNKYPVFTRIIRDTINTNTDRHLVRRLKKEMDQNKLTAALYGTTANTTFEKPWCSGRVSPVAWSTRIAGALSQPMDTTPQRMKIYEEITDWIPKALNLDEAVKTLELINMLVVRSHANTLKSMRHVTGVVNHCIDQINKGTGLSWSDILTNYGDKFDNLLDKMRSNGMDDKVYHPVKKAN